MTARYNIFCKIVLCTYTFANLFRFINKLDVAEMILRPLASTFLNMKVVSLSWYQTNRQLSAT